MKKNLLRLTIAVCMAATSIFGISGIANATQMNDSEKTISSEQPENKTVLKAGKDTNALPYEGFDFMSSSSLKKMYKKHRIWVPDIVISQKKKKAVVKYGKVPGADLYEIRYSQKIKRSKLKNAKTIRVNNTKKTISLRSKKTVYIQIRPVMKKNNKEYNGMWSGIYYFKN